MTIVGLDDTDSRDQGMCTTYVAARIADRLADRGYAVERYLLRLNPAVEHKTRGNAALAVETDAPRRVARRIAREHLSLAADGPRTDPGAVVAGDTDEGIADFARRAMRAYCDSDRAARLARDREWDVLATGRGIVGAVAAVGAPRVRTPTVECISYRESSRRGTERSVDHDTVFAAAERAYPDAWDTVDRTAGRAVCVPRAPGPILHGIRGDDPTTVARVARAIESEPVERRAIFRTNQGTDAHLREATIDDCEDGYSYRVTGQVVSAPDTREGGHVFATLGTRLDPAAAADGGAAVDHAERSPSDAETIDLVAFEPTERFRDHVRALRVGDRVTVCGEVSDGTLKLEKVAVRDLRRSEWATPDCPACGRSMESAGRAAGYRCRDCSTSAPGRVERPIERDIAIGWYEVPPLARRHVAKPLVRGGFDAPIHPER
ncbi:tRNA(Ile)(2)-agmatinylcytidine synthase [Halococcoides cellulosivorans]|uniref:tRNA(Ile2) 2-agmatinylcytidine synthetase TiaS n=1 Tax=Halococcoides cellulosivorans TaxID=1679096 RepID=A0A2R4X444_9EURY|nr:tRNA(Ile)(2)-agmatinylcytidine synthase [Halococcoides cellulosivorans]AWB28559.1 tRNA(Ile2) 2-agmatinylcytidine synthetase [Halococcoides cellulosivorans]